MTSSSPIVETGSAAGIIVSNRTAVLRLADIVGNMPEVAFVAHAYRSVLNREPESDVRPKATSTLSVRVRYIAGLFASVEAGLLYRGDHGRAARALAVVLGQSTAAGLIETLILTQFDNYDAFKAGLPSLADEIARNTMTMQLLWLDQEFDPAISALKLAQQMSDRSAMQSARITELYTIIDELNATVRDMRAAASRRRALPASSIDDVLAIAARLVDDHRRSRM